MGRNVVVTVVRGFNIPDVQRLGKMDPYAVLEYNQYEHKTRTHENGDKNPVWNQSFEISAEPSNPQVRITIFNDKRSHDPVIGIARIDFSKVFEKGLLHNSFPLFTTENHQHGHIEVSFKSPEILAEIEAARAAEAEARRLEALRIADAKERYEKALADARTERTREASVRAIAQEDFLATYLNGHRSVAARYIAAHKQLVDDEVVGHGVTKADTDAKELERALDADAKGFANAVVKAIPESETFGFELAEHGTSIEALDDRRAAEIAAAAEALKDGIARQIAEYKEKLSHAQDRYLQGAEVAALEYLKGVKAKLAQEAEELAVQDAQPYLPE